MNIYDNNKGSCVMVKVKEATTRKFESGATRSADDGKLDYDGFFSPDVLERRARYMHKYRVNEDGTLRESGNWKKGIPTTSYMKSAWRHFMDVWKGHHGLPTQDTLEDSLCALMFNIEGYLFELLRKPRYGSASSHPFNLQEEK